MAWLLLGWMAVVGVKQRAPVAKWRFQAVSGTTERAHRYLWQIGREMPTVSPGATLCYTVKHPRFVLNWSHHNTLNTNQPHTYAHTPSLQPTDSCWGGSTSSMRAIELYKTPTPAKKLHITNVRFIASFLEAAKHYISPICHFDLPTHYANTRPNPPPSYIHALKTHATGTYLPNDDPTDVPTDAALAVSRLLESYSMQFLAHACRWQYLPQQ
jgi:hypothetical protein